MSRHNLLKRIRIYYHREGFRRTMRRICEQPRLVTKGYRLVFGVEMNSANDSILTLPPRISIESKSTYDEAVQPGMLDMIDYWRKEDMMEIIKYRYEIGAILWMMKLNEDIAAFGWSIRGDKAFPFYFPTTVNDLILFDYFTFEGYRGRGLYPLLLNYILEKQKSVGVRRAFIYVSAWNKSSIRGIEKTSFRKLCKARIYHLFKRNFMIWSK